LIWVKEDNIMDKIWANRLVAGTKTWEQVPASRKDAVLAELRSRVEDGEITAEKFEAITGEAYE
jgi:hypothetical protein